MYRLFRFLFLSLVATVASASGATYDFHASKVSIYLDVIDESAALAEGLGADIEMINAMARYVDHVNIRLTETPSATCSPRIAQAAPNLRLVLEMTFGASEWSVDFGQVPWPLPRFAINPVRDLTCLLFDLVVWAGASPVPPQFTVAGLKEYLWKLRDFARRVAPGIPFSELPPESEIRLRSDLSLPDLFLRLFLADIRFCQRLDVGSGHRVEPWIELRRTMRLPFRFEQLTVAEKKQTRRGPGAGNRKK